MHLDRGYPANMSFWGHVQWSEAIAFGECHPWRSINLCVIPMKFREKRWLIQCVGNFEVVVCVFVAGAAAMRWNGEFFYGASSLLAFVRHCLLTEWLDLAAHIKSNPSSSLQWVDSSVALKGGQVIPRETFIHLSPSQQLGLPAPRPWVSSILSYLLSPAFFFPNFLCTFRISSWLWRTDISYFASR